MGYDDTTRDAINTLKSALTDPRGRRAARLSEETWCDLVEIYEMIGDGRKVEALEALHAILVDADYGAVLHPSTVLRVGDMRRAGK